MMSNERVAASITWFTGLLIFGVAMIGMGTIAILAYWQHSSVLTDRSFSLLDASARESAAIFSDEINDLSRDVRFLSGTPPILGIARSASEGVDPIDGSTHDIWKRRLAVIFEEMQRVNPHYDQIRYIGVANGGRELVRVDDSLAGPTIIDENDLQQKAARDYFNETISSEAGKVYLSPIQLNREFGEITTPKKPVIRAALPIDLADGNRFGMVVINLSLSKVVERIKSRLSADESLTIADETGNILVHSDESKTFGYEFGHPITLSDLGINLALTLDGGYEGSLTDESGQQITISARKLLFDPGNRDRWITFAILAPHDLLIRKSVESRNYSFTAAFVFLFLAAGGALLAIHYLSNISPSEKARTRWGLSWILPVMLVATIFGVDLSVPTGIAVGTLYAIPVLVMLALRSNNGTLIAAILGTLLTVVGFLMSTVSDAAEYIVVVNRGFSIAIIWTTTLLGIRIIRSDQAVRQLNQELENRVEERTRRLRTSEELFRSVVDNAPLGIFRIDADGRYLDTNPTTSEILGFGRDMLERSYFVDMLHPEELSLGEQMISHLIDGSREVKSFLARHRTKSGLYIWCRFTAQSVWKADESFAFTIVLMEDVTSERNEQHEISVRLKEKEVLLKEIHHRVKNNLQIISSLLNLQMRQVGDAQVTKVLKDSQQRIETMALMHEKLYQSDNMAKVNLAEYLRDLTASQFALMENGSEIDVHLDLDDAVTTLDTAIPVGLIVNEAITNCVKHAFNGRESGSVSVHLKLNDSEVVLQISDNGVGIGDGIDPETSGTLGMRLTRILAEQIRAVLKWTTQDVGLTMQLSFRV